MIRPSHAIFITFEYNINRHVYKQIIAFAIILRITYYIPYDTGVRLRSHHKPSTLKAIRF